MGTLSTVVINESLAASLCIFGLFSLLWLFVGNFFIERSSERLDKLPLYKFHIILAIYWGPLGVFVLLPLGFTIYAIGKILKPIGKILKPIGKILKPISNWLWEEDVKSQKSLNDGRPTKNK